MEFKSVTQFSNHPLHFFGCTDSDGFCAELLDSGFGKPGHVKYDIEHSKKVTIRLFP